jgi:hypothetical protein
MRTPDSGPQRNWQPWQVPELRLPMNRTPTLHPRKLSISRKTIQHDVAEWVGANGAFPVSTPQASSPALFARFRRQRRLPPFCLPCFGWPTASLRGRLKGGLPRVVGDLFDTWNSPLDKLRN